MDDLLNMGGSLEDDGEERLVAKFLKKTTAKKADGEAVAKKPAAKKTSTAKKTASKDAE